MGTSADKPYIDVIYKLCETTNKKGVFSPIMKLSEGKATLPGRKQVFRFKDKDGNFEKDVIALADEKVRGEPLLVKVMENGKLTFKFPSIEKIRANALDNLAKLPEKYQKLTQAPTYPVEVSQELENLIRRLKRRLRKTEVLNPV